MEVVLLENVKKLGQIGEVVKVKRGHARNYLIKYGKALNASKENIELVNKRKVELNKTNIEIKRNAIKIYNIINKKKYKIAKRAMENDKLYGSVKPKEITDLVENVDKIKIKTSMIDLSKEINKIGNYEAQVNLHAEVSATILIEVVKEGEKDQGV